MTPALQSKLLRVLQQREFERVGGTRPIRVDIRIIAATNRNLQDEVDRGTFREDLFYRLNVVTVGLPPLRDRKEDIPQLAAWFVTRYAESAGRHIRGISPEAMCELTAYDWPGNVRELENVMARAAVLGSEDEVLPNDLPDVILKRKSLDDDRLDLRSSVADTKRQAIIDAFAQTQGKHAEAARLLRVHPVYLHRLIRSLDLRDRLKGSTFR
jgi:DNA-binding NtrC family response regulator